MKVKALVEVTVRLEHEIEVDDEVIAGNEGLHPEDLAEVIQRADDDQESEYIRQLPLVDLANGVGEVQDWYFVSTEIVREPSDAGGAE